VPPPPELEAVPGKASGDEYRSVDLDSREMARGLMRDMEAVTAAAAIGAAIAAAAAACQHMFMEHAGLCCIEGQGSSRDQRHLEFKTWHHRLASFEAVQALSCKLSPPPGAGGCRMRSTCRRRRRALQPC